MGVVSLSLPADGSTGTVSQYNTPLTTIQTELNGRLDTNNIAAGGVGTSQLAAASVTSAKLSVTPTADANGWTVIDLGGVKLATKRVTFSQTVATTGSTLTLSSTNLPVAIANLSLAKSMVFSTNVTGFAYALTVNFEGATTATALNFTAKSSDSSRGYDGTISITFII
jgi:hypothetical protein